MKTLLAAILLATVSTTASAQLNSRQIRFMCGNFEQVTAVMKEYNEKLILAAPSPNKQLINLLFANFETQTTSWFIQDLETNEYCMMGVGDQIYIPKDSPLNQKTGTGKKINYK